ncbi:MAG: ROK family protein [Porticoccaceae bacterium]
MKKNSDKLFAAIEAGGTKFVIAIGNTNEIKRKISIPTRDPDTTWRDALGFLKQTYLEMPFSAIAMASFGPLDLNEKSQNYGRLTNTPKAGWQDAHMLAPLRSFNLPIALETDVSAAALGEALLGQGRDKNTVAYVTVGTGIGAGIVRDGQILNGATHPEIGHIPLPQDINSDPFPGICPFHKNCLEGLASGKAIHARWSSNLNDLEQDHPAYAIQAQYLGYLCSVLMLCFSPDKILLGGGVMQSKSLLEKSRDSCFNYLNGYPKKESLEQIIERPAHEGTSALIGGFILADRLIKSTR